jgi:hypothetical protein
MRYCKPLTLLLVSVGVFAQLLLPPLALRMNVREALWYLVLAFGSSPAIHVIFSVFVGRPEYLPFWHVPSLWSA